MSTAALYLRVSTEEQADQNISIPFQRSRLMAYCESKGWDIFDIYIDPGCSGKDLNRPDITRLIKDSQENKFDVVLVWKLDRLSRRQQHVMHLVEDIFHCNDESGIQLASVTENFDTTTPMGRAMLGIMAVFAQLERETIVERVTESRAEAARQGRFLGGHIMYGYKHNPAVKGLEIDEVKAETVKWIYEQYLAGKGFTAIAQLLTKRKIKSPNGGNIWRGLAIQRIITNPGYAGFIEHRGQIHKGRHFGIISKETWDKAQEVLQSRSHFRPQNKTHSLLNGIIYCAECGARMRKKAVGNRDKRYYVCYSVEGSSKHMVKDKSCPGRYYTADDIEAKVVRKLLQLHKHPDRLRKAAKQDIDSVVKEDNSRQIKTLAKELEDVKKRIRKWQDAFETDAISLDEMRERTQELKERRQIIENELAAYQEVAATREQAEITLDELVEEMSHFKEVWDSADFDGRRLLVTGIISKVLVNKDGQVKLEF